MFCGKCGSQVESNQTYCASCGNPLSNNNNVQENISYHQEQGSLDEKLLEDYIGNNYNKITSEKFSFSAFFLSSAYLLYRKLYLYGILLMVVSNILLKIIGNMSNILIFIFIIVLGINFNKWYVEYAKKQVTKIKNQNQSATYEVLKQKCKTAGGTNIGIALLIYFAVALAIEAIL